jgi:hypothetical protein
VARGCAFKVRLDDGAKHTVDVPFNLGPDGKGPTSATVTPGFVVKSTSVDPLSECLIWAATSAKMAVEPPGPRVAAEPWRAPARK